MFFKLLTEVRPILKSAIAILISLIWAVSVQSAGQTIVVLGDSLSSGYGLRIEQSWVSKLEARLRMEGYGYEVINASIAGDTTSGGLARLPRILELHQPAIIIIELGGNDGLRGQPVSNLRTNLIAMIELAKGRGALVVLTGIQIPPNYGQTYTNSFSAVYTELAAEFDLPLVEFLMDNVALDVSLMQSDGIHPNAGGNDVMLENVWAVLAELL
ncbi:MAG: arylesterase [Candidatus Rariloculaceae bacterium]